MISKWKNAFLHRLALNISIHVSWRTFYLNNNVHVNYGARKSILNRHANPLCFCCKVLWEILRKPQKYWIRFSNHTLTCKKKWYSVLSIRYLLLKQLSLDGNIELEKTMYSFTVLLSTIPYTFYNTIFIINIKMAKTAVYSNVGIGHTLTRHIVL